MGLAPPIQIGESKSRARIVVIPLTISTPIISMLLCIFCIAQAALPSPSSASFLIRKSLNTFTLFEFLISIE